MLTHNDAGSTAACVAFVSMLWQLLAMTSPPPAQWWLETYVATARELEGDTRYRPRSEHVEAYEGPIWRFVQERVGAAFRKNLSVLDAGDSWYSGAYLLETVPSVVYILMRHGHDPEEAIVRAVNDTKDNDTVAAIVGAAVGALHGRAGITKPLDRQPAGPHDGLRRRASLRPAGIGSGGSGEGQTRVDLALRCVSTG